MRIKFPEQRKETMSVLRLNGMYYPEPCTSREAQNPATPPSTSSLILILKPKCHTSQSHHVQFQQSCVAREDHGFQGGRPLAWSGNKSTSSQGYSSSASPWDAKLVEQNFATDMNLNFPNLSVIGLRILLPTAAGLNLLLTPRLWSS